MILNHSKHKEMSLNKIRNYPFLLITISLFIVLIVPTLIKDGMFLDGVNYAAISKNLANGIGTFWQPHYTKTLYTSFHEQPPLVFGIQAIFFKLLGNHIYVERIYSFLTGILTLLLIIKIWNFIHTKFKSKQLNWLPVSFWIITPIVFWSYSNNMLENTLGIFCLASIFYIIKSILANTRQSVLYIFLASLFIVAGFLSKGFVALYPLSTVFIYWLVFRKLSFQKMLILSVLIFFIATLILSLIMIIQHDAFKNLSTYFNQQVIKSLSGAREVSGGRFNILNRLYKELLPVIFISMIFIVIKFRKNKALILHDSSVLNNFLFFLFIGISASLPLMISPKQLGFYLVPSIPYYAIGFGSLIMPILINWINKIDISKRGFQMFKMISIISLAGAIVISISQVGKTGRDKVKLHDIYKIGKVIDNGSLISVSEYICKDWWLIAYFSRYFYISLDCKNTNHEYYLYNGNSDICLSANYSECLMQLKRYRLFKLQKK